jgi:hypothetical protein
MAFVLLVPYALVPLYRAVDLVSTLMLWWRGEARAGGAPGGADRPHYPDSAALSRRQRSAIRLGRARAARQLVNARREGRFGIGNKVFPIPIRGPNTTYCPPALATEATAPVLPKMLQIRPLPRRTGLDSAP